MAEYAEVMKQKRRMCNSVLCCKCDIYRLCGEDLSKCAQFINNNPKKAEEVIMSWAAEHPEPVYPSIAKYLEQFGITIRRDSSLEADFFRANEPMSAEMAKLLGIEPKENT